VDDHKPSATARPSQGRRPTEEKLAELVECYRHGLLGVEERLELRDRIARVRRRLREGLGSQG
jgi:hypothetical protein